MYLTFRRAQVSDFETGFSFVRARHGYDDALRKDMFKLWGALLENGHEPMAVVEDRDREPGKRQVAFGTSFFAYDWFVEEARTSFPPRLDLRMMERWRAGKRPFLLKKELTEAQLNGGLNAVAFNWGWDTQRYGPEEMHKIGTTQAQSYIAMVSHFRLKQFLQEARGTEARDRLLNFGVDVLRDYREFSGMPQLSAPTADNHPFLMGVVLEKVLKDRKKAGTAVDRMARLGPPRYGFRTNEQEVLKRALEGETDEEIARSLHLTLVTVKRRWQGIYAKVEAVDDGLLGADSDSTAMENSGPKQRRRFLVKSLADHPEEFWPMPGTKKTISGRKTKI